MLVQADLAARIQLLLLQRNEVSARYIPRHSMPLAISCQEMSRRFLSGGRLLAIGHGPYATDAQHVSVEFIHPIMVGKRALPALDLSAAPAAWLDVLLRPEDIVMGFGPPAGDAQIHQWVAAARARGALTYEWPGHLDRHPLPAASDDPFIHQELTELMYHTLWETVHVFFEQAEKGDDLGDASFLYPSLARGDSAPTDTLAQVEASIRQKALEDERLRSQAAETCSELLADAAVAIYERLRLGGTLLAFGNGGSATDANDLVLDCIMPPAGMRPIPAISLAIEPANLSAIGNDVGIELIFLRQLIANSRPGDVAVAISTSGTSKNICAALGEARKRGLLTIALVGSDGGDVVRNNLADFALVVKCDYIPRLQEIQASLYHVLRSAVAMLDPLP
jgi:D-sedoheptulose 7-phosphate isomerase